MGEVEFQTSSSSIDESIDISLEDYHRHSVELVHIRPC